MTLLSQQLLDRFNELGEQNEFKNPLLLAKLYSVKADVAFYPISYKQEFNVCYGYVVGMIDDGFTTFSISHLENRIRTCNSDLKQDMNFKEIRFNDFIKTQT